MNKYLRLLTIVMTLTSIETSFGYNPNPQPTAPATPGMDPNAIAANNTLFNSVGGLGWGNIGYAAPTGTNTDPFGFPIEDANLTLQPTS